MAKKITKPTFSVDKFILEGIINSVWNKFVSVGLPCVNVNNTIPITWFGDLEKYEKSKLRIVTIGINPSFYEFRKKACHSNSVSLRFKDASHLAGKKSLNKADIKNYADAMNRYFENNPYISWFKDYEKIINRFCATYGGKLFDAVRFNSLCNNNSVEIPQKCNNDVNTINHAIHIDACTPIATNPTWRGVSNNCKSLLEDFVICRVLIDILSPHLIFISTGKDKVDGVFGNEYWIDVLHKNSNIYIRTTKNSNGQIIVWGSNRSKPFSGLSNIEIKAAMNIIKPLL